MSDPISTKRFSEINQKKIGCCAILFYFIILVGISSSLNSHLHLVSLIGDDFKMVMADDATKANIKTTGCRSSNYCEIDGEARVEPNSSTIYILVGNTTNSWIIEPYPRTGRTNVRKWRVRTLARHQENVPKCSQYHNHPAILFSLRGFLGNHFHDFADALFPLYLTSSDFKRDVQFVTSGHKPWWPLKYKQILNKLTKHDILDIDGETSQVHCYNKMRIGLQFYRELRTNPSLSRPSPSMHAFRLLLREAYSLKRDRAVRAGNGAPRLMIIDRKRTRVLTNTRQVSSLATRMGFEVVVVEPSMDVPGSVETVNSCDVLMGVHGAGLTNMLFLPDDAVVIQVIPLGRVDEMADIYYGDPTAGMNLRYLGYKITVKESSLSRKYSLDHPVLSNPESYRDWGQMNSIYLQQQNVTIDLPRFTGTLLEALKLLRR